jgi:hypothetical protein
MMLMVVGVGVVGRAEQSRDERSWSCGYGCGLVVADEREARAFSCSRHDPFSLLLLLKYSTSF